VSPTAIQQSLMNRLKKSQPGKIQVNTQK
jgi:hypothetical protein